MQGVLLHIQLQIGINSQEIGLTDISITVPKIGRHKFVKPISLKVIFCDWNKLIDSERARFPH